VVVDPSGQPVTNATPSGYGPSDLRSAYNLTSSGSSSQTIGIVDAFDNPNAEHDVNVYRAQFGLPSCTTANGCFRKVDQSGGTSYPRGDANWGQEIDLDIEMASAICPSCKILLVEANSAQLADLGTAVNTAVQLGATVVSNSYGGGENAGEVSQSDTYYKHPGVPITASSGDNGYGVEFPAASQYVTAAGGTSLTKTAGGWSETVWSGAGSGCSAYIPKPSWQTDAGCANRTVADVSAVADPNTGVAVYDSYGRHRNTGWLVFGGTSVASPIIASVYALAANSGGSSYASYPYSHTSALHDVTSGSNGSCGGSYLCTAGAGYDGPTGLGTPNGTGAF
jgi:subtilase family serine protease